tara:strand:+ start:2231 stop:2650 length:420 start_codon:yes stop_codon:yes gene_type:complete
MKIHVVRPDQQAIENFTRVNISNNLVDLTQLSDNECELILANDAMDSYSVDRAGELLQSLVSKLRLGGELVVGGTSIRLLCKQVLNSQLDEQQASQIVGSVASLTSPEPLVQTLSSMGLEILESTMSGIHYEVKAKRVK